VIIVKPSPRFSLNTLDYKSILRGAAVALAAALLTYLAELIPNVDFGEYTAVVVALSGILINAARKFLGGK
jgi:hypothetical protein